MTNRMTNIILLLILSIFWSATFLFVKIADHDFDPITLMAGRALISFLFIFMVVIILKKPIFIYLKQCRTQLVFIFSGITVAYMWYTIAACEKVLTVGMASFLLTTLVIVSWIITTFFTREKPFHYINLFGIILAVLGVVTMLGYKNIFEGNRNIWYALLYISGITVFLIGVAVNKKSRPGIDSFVSTAYNLFYAAIILVASSLLFESPLQHHYGLSSILSVVGVGLISTGVGYLIFFWLVAHAGQLFASYNGYLVPIFGFLMGAFLLSEPYYWYQLIGLAIVFVGMYFTNYSKVASG